MGKNQEQVFTSLGQLVKSIESTYIENWLKEFKTCTTLEQFILLKGKMVAYEEIVAKAKKSKVEDDDDDDSE